MLLKGNLPVKEHWTISQTFEFVFGCQSVNKALLPFSCMSRCVGHLGTSLDPWAIAYWYGKYSTMLLCKSELLIYS